MKKNQIVIINILILISFLETFSQENLKTLDDYILDHSFDIHGKEFVKIIVPGIPPEKHREPVAIPSRSAVLLNYVPAFDWSFGCSATSAAMAAGYYDNNGYPNMYAGPSNYGFMPMNNSIWGYVVINGETRAQCPLSATRNAVDGRTTRGHVDDYWIQTGNNDQDPFISNGWTEHTLGECTGDYMRTNQSNFNNSDGSTMFGFYVDGSPLMGTDGEGCYGLKQFYESRGYSVVSFFSQYIYGWDGNTLGFTFNQYKQEINNGRPVLIQLEGHTVIGYGYDDAGQTVYLHDTWDYSSHTMTWGGSYANLAHYGVGVVQLQPSNTGIIANFSANINRQLINTTVSLSDWSFGNPTSWNWSISPSTYVFTGGTSSSSQNPQVQFTAGGFYNITLTASKTGYADFETKTNFIEAVDCSNFAFPLSEDFSEGALPFCWQNLDNQGSGQVWHFNNPSGWVINTATAYNGFAMLDSDHYGDGGNQNADLVTPALNLSSYSNINLSFQHHFRPWGGSSGTLSYSINGGSTWTAIQTWTTDSGNPAVFNQVITAVAGQSNVKFKWNYTGSYGYYWAVDDISITGTLAGHWTGVTSTSWTTGSNWSNGAAPTSTTNVTIPASAPNWPVYTGNLTMGTNCGNITMNGASQLTITGSLTIAAGKALTMTGNGLLKVRGNWANNGTFQYGPGTVEFYGNSNGTVTGTIIPAFHNVVISKSSTYNLNLNVNTVVNNNFNVNPGAAFRVMNGKSLTIQ